MWSSGIQAGIQDTIVTSVQQFIHQHPNLAWIMTHPFWLVGLVLLALFLFWGLLQAITRLTERLWLAILQAPLKLTQWFLGLLSRMFWRKSATPSTPTKSADPQQRLAAIVDRLEALRQEQEALMREMKEILAIRPS